VYVLELHTNLLDENWHNISKSNKHVERKHV